jgi:hypothetical protein
MNPPPQTTAELLGYPADARPLIINDLGIVRTGYRSLRDHQRERQRC